jgi:hypothetical protein
MKFLHPILFVCFSQTLAFMPRFVRNGPSIRLFSSSGDDKKETGHLSSSSMPKISEEDEKLIAKFREHQSTAARPTMAEDVRTLIDQSIGYGVLSTNSDQYPGFPTGSVVGFALQDDGKPFFVFSTMSAHTKDVLKDSKCSLTVLAKDFQGAAEGRVVLVGTAKKVFDKEIQTKLREKYLAKHKDAYWIDFGYVLHSNKTRSTLIDAKYSH